MYDRKPQTLLFTFLLTLFFAASPVQAQETQPGDACTAGEADHFMRVGGPENPGTGYFLVCDGATWKAITEWDTGDGSSFIQFGNDTANACNTVKTGRLSYTGAAWKYCDGSSWQDLATGGGGSGLWTDSGSGYIEYSSALGGILVGGVSGQPAPVMP